jgi:hypothetical protein
MKFDMEELQVAYPLLFFLNKSLYISYHHFIAFFFELVRL